MLPPATPTPSARIVTPAHWQDRLADVILALLALGTTALLVFTLILVRRGTLDAQALLSPSGMAATGALTMILIIRTRPHRLSTPLPDHAREMRARLRTFIWLGPMAQVLIALTLMGRMLAPPREGGAMEALADAGTWFTWGILALGDAILLIRRAVPDQFRPVKDTAALRTLHLTVLKGGMTAALAGSTGLLILARMTSPAVAVACLPLALSLPLAAMHWRLASHLDDFCRAAAESLPPAP